MRPHRRACPQRATPTPRRTAVTLTKKIFLALGAFALLLAVALAALVAFVDVNAFKPQIEQAVKDRTNRTLAIDGDLSLAVFPRLAVALPKTTLSQPGSPAPFASVDGARVSVALWPLLRGRVEADRVVAQGLTATIERRADGRTNVDDLIGRDAAARQGAGAPPASGPPAFEIGGVTLVDASLTYRDVVANTTLALTRLNLELGRVAAQGRTPLRLSTQFAATSPAAQGELAFDGVAEVDLERRVYGARSVEMTLKAMLGQRPLELRGKAGELRFDAGGGALAVAGLDVGGRGAWGDGASQRFEVQLQVPKVEADATAARGERATARVKLAGPTSGEVGLSVESLSGTTSALAIGRLALEASLQQPLGADRTRRIVATVASPAGANLAARTLVLPQVSGELRIDDPALAQKSLTLPMQGTLSLDAAKQVADARLRTRVDETTLAAQLGVRGFAPVRLTFDAEADRLDVDRYLVRPATGASAGQGAPAAAGPIDVSGLKDLRLAGEARVAWLQVRGIQVHNARVGVRADGGRLAAAPVTASLYRGRVDATAFVQSDQRFGLDATLTGVDVGALLKDATGDDTVAGRGNVTLALTTRGASADALKRALAGQGAFVLRDGAVKGVNIERALRNANALLAGGRTESASGSADEQTDFSTLSASFVVRDGVARSDDLDLRSALLRLGGSGEVDLAAGTLDYTVRATVVGTLRGPDGREVTALRGATVPVRLEGPLAQPRYSIDWGDVAKEQLKARAAEALTGRPPRAPDDKPRDSIEQRARDALKGLFGR